MELFKAHKQWAERPDDERFWNLTELHQATKAYAGQAIEKPFFYKDLTITANGKEDVLVTGRSGIPVPLTNWGYTQLCARAGAPASYLRKLPAQVAADALNYGLQKRADASDEDGGKMLVHANGSYVARAFLSNDYSRIWNHQVANALLLLPSNWTVPPARPAPTSKGTKTRPATEADVLAHSQSHALGIKVGDPIAPAGLYASDHDMFAFLVDESKTVDNLCRGVMVGNSEVGASSLWFLFFYYDAICGNHIVWGARDVSEMRVRHVGDLAMFRAQKVMEVELNKWANESASDDAAKIASSRRILLGDTKDDVLSAVYKLRINELSKVRIEAAYDLAAITPRYGDPRSVWGMVNGLTELSQQTPYTDERTRIDRAAGKLLESVF